jgi:CRP/FNR family transcriptional regulator
MNVQNLLASTGFFSELSPDSLSALETICLPRCCEKNQILFHQGDRGYAVYLLVSGSVQLYKTTRGGKDVVIRTIKPGELFAEVILLEQDRYPVTAVCLLKSTMLILPRHQFHCLLEKQSFRNDFIKLLMRKQRYLAGRIEYLSTYDVERRFFLFLEEQYGRKRRIELRVAKKNIAAAIGTTPETLSRLLLRLKDDGVIEIDGDTIKVEPGIWESNN